MKTTIRIWLFLCAIPFAILGIIEGNLWYMLGATTLAFIALVGAKQIELPKLENTPTWCMVFTASIIFALMATWSARNTPTDWFAGLLWLMVIVGLIIAAWLHDRSEIMRVDLQNSTQKWRQKWSWGEIAIIGLFTAVAFALRAYRIEILPPLHGDEGEMGELAVRILQGDDPLPLFVTKWLGHPTLFHYLQAGSIWLFRWFFDQDVTGLRLLSSFFGALCVPVIYSLARQGWGRVAGLTAAWLLTISHLHIQYSRIGLNNIQTVWSFILLLALLATVAKVITMQRENNRRKDRINEQQLENPANNADKISENDTEAPSSLLEIPRLYMPFIGAGLLIGVAQYLYFGSRLMWVIWIPLLAYLWLRKAANVEQIMLSIVSFIAVYLPLLLYYLEYPIRFIERANLVSIFNDKEIKRVLTPEASWPQDALQLLWHQLEHNLRFFIDFGDKSPFYYPVIPGFDQVTAVLFWLGLGIALTKILRYHEFSVLLWFGVGLLLGGILTGHSPYGARLIVMVPSVFVIAGIFAQTFYNLFSNSHLQIRRIVFGTTLFFIVSTTAWLNINLYFVEYAKAPPRSLFSAIAQEMMITPEEYDTYLMGAPVLYARHGTIKFVAKSANAQDLENVNALLEIQHTKANSYESTDDKPSLLVIILTPKLDQLPLLQKEFPGGKTDVHEDALGRYLFTSYRIESVE